MTEYEDFRSPAESQKSSTFGAAINLSKLAIGTGVLALPYATSRGGLLFGPVCLALIALWNGVACRYFKQQEVIFWRKNANDNSDAIVGGQHRGLRMAPDRLVSV
jgi:amino acid permease